MVSALTAGLEGRQEATDVLNFLWMRVTKDDEIAPVPVPCDAVGQ